MSTQILPPRTPEQDHADLVRAIAFRRATPLLDQAREALVEARVFVASAPGTIDWSDWLDDTAAALEQEIVAMAPDVKAANAIARRLTSALGARDYMDAKPGEFQAWELAIAAWRDSEPRPRSRASRKDKRSTSKRKDQSAIRTWARANGWPDLADRGRMPVAVAEAYAKAHG